ncbi:restriction endonuclease [Pseudoduganella sp. UC29_106]|uniref:restriction endonuclease n=1 Tax=Pseudoduganella sp. UC29_106 TaxID=3374553 RepID=UPI0037567314
MMTILLRGCIPLLSKFLNVVRLIGLPNHQRNVRKSRRVLRTVRRFREPGLAGRCLCYLRQVDPLVFEEVVMSALEDAGLLVLRNRSYTGDGGIDGAVWSPRCGWLAVQMKRYRAHICRGHLRDFGDAIQYMNFDGGLFIHTGRSGAGAYEFLRDSGIILLSGDRLITLLSKRKLMRWRMR